MFYDVRVPVATMCVPLASHGRCAAYVHTVLLSSYCIAATVLSMDEEDDLSDLVNGSDQYGDELKLKCMYSVLHRFSRFLRLGVFPDDTRFLFVATLCRLIDVARKRHPPQSDSLAFDLWDLNALSSEQDTFLGTSNSVASPGLASTAERMNWLEQLILRNDYIK